MADPIITYPESQFVPGTEGFYEIPNAKYHDPEAAPGISRTLIVEFLTLTPAHAQSLIAGDYAKVVTKQMTSGNLFDQALLEPDKFKEGVSHWVIPEGMKLSTKEGIAWKKDHPDLPYLPAKSDAANVASAEDIKGMIDSVMRHTKAKVVVEQSIKQESGFSFDPDTGLLRKVRPDARLIDKHSRLVLADIKSTFRGGASKGVWAKHCARMSYHIQDSFYSDLYRDMVGEMPFFLFIVVERKPPYAVRIFQLDPVGKNHARDKYKRALESFRICQETGVWPAFDEEIQTVSLPSWELQSPMPDPVEL